MRANVPLLWHCGTAALWQASTGFYDFYELAAPWVGCAEPRARNYGGEQVTVNDDSCQDLDPCAELAKGRHDHDRGACDRWREWCEKPCTEGNVGYRNVSGLACPCTYLAFTPMSASRLPLTLKDGAACATLAERERHGARSEGSPWLDHHRRGPT